MAWADTIRERRFTTDELSTVYCNAEIGAFDIDIVLVQLYASLMRTKCPVL
jgi:hypothetical protein